MGARCAVLVRAVQSRATARLRQTRAETVAGVCIGVDRKALQQVVGVQ